MNEANKTARNNLKGFLGAFREAGELAKVFDTLEAAEDQVNALAAQKVALGSDVADLGDQRKALVTAVNGLQGTRDEAFARLDADMKAVKSAAEDKFAAQREAMRRELETLTIQIGTARETHDATMQQIRIERERAEAQLEAVRADLAKLKAKLA